MGFIIMEPEHTPPMSGSNSICVSTVLLDTGIIEMQEPETHMVLEAPGGLIHVRAECADGKAQRIFVRNVASFAGQMDAELQVEGIGRLRVDTAYGGDSFGVVDAGGLGLEMAAHEARDIAVLGARITAAANAQLGFTPPPENPDWRHISFCLFATAPQDGPDGPEVKHAVVIAPGKVDRSPTGTAVSAQLALMHQRGQISQGVMLTARSLIGSQFQGQIVETVTLGGKPAIVPEISGRGWIIDMRQRLLDPSDPWPRGYRVNDTWPLRQRI